MQRKILQFSYGEMSQRFLKLPVLEVGTFFLGTFSTNLVMFEIVLYSV